ncbi:MAG: GDP-mannose 4,6-dehydratase [Gemmatimonadota bacterium]|nr:GDP-mannose 4,6-dehydratase [Gemmatimonadota bacterium]
MRALVTGAAGFVGQWMCRELLQRGWDVTATIFGDLPTGALDPDERRVVRWVPTDLRRPEQLGDAVDVAAPDAIVHLAGVAFVPAATADPGSAFEVNTVVAARLLGEVRARRAAGTLDPAVLVVGTGEQYGRHDDSEMPLAESAEQRPQSVYAASKAAQEIAALEAWRTSGVRVLCTRSFNHSGPGQASSFLLPSLVARALAARDSRQPTLSLGNTTPVRDFLHVADVVRAYALLVEKGAPGDVYNVASGRGTDVAALAARVLAAAGVDAKLQIDSSLVRSADVPVLIGDPRKLESATGWTPEHSLDSLIDELVRAASA